MRATGQTTTRRFVAAYALAGITFVAVLVPSFIVGLPGMLFLVPPLIAAYAVLFVLSRTPWFRDVVRRLTHGPYLIVSIALAAILGKLPDRFPRAAVRVQRRGAPYGEPRPRRHCCRHAGGRRLRRRYDAYRTAGAGEEHHLAVRRGQ